MIYAFILGRNTALSIAEILSVLKRESFVFVILSISSKTIIIKLNRTIQNPQSFLNCFGGTIKIARILEGLEERATSNAILKYISDNFRRSKFIFGISAYGIKIGNLGYDLKKKLKTIGINSRFIRGKEKYLSAPEIQNNKILNHGADFVLIKNENTVFLGITVAIQDYRNYSQRDYDRPRRNAKSGMLPPKVAQIMLNIIPDIGSKNKSSSLIYDPFCGQGTILQEAYLIGYSAVGSDVSLARVADTKKNLKWLAKKYGIKIEPEKIVFQIDALQMKETDLLMRPKIIVSEVYLGPPLKERASDQSIIEITKNLEEKYKKLFKNKYLTSNIKYMVLALPFYQTRNGRYYLNIIDEIKNAGYNIIDLFQEHKAVINFIPEYNKERKNILYSRPDQMVGREIIVLKKK